MHCVCEGILKRQLFNRWLNPNFASESYSLVGFTVEVNEILLSIQVPHDCNRKPRSLDDLKHWKASEFRLFVLFTGLPCLRDAVLSDHLYHFALLTTALRKLHLVPLSKVCVEKSQVLLDNVVRLLPNLYDNKSVPSTATLCFIFLTRYLTMVPCLSHLCLFFKLFEASKSQEFILWSRDYVKGNCKDIPAAARFAQHLLLESENVRIIDGGMLLHEPVLYKKLDDQFHSVLHKTFGVGADAEHLVSYRLTKDHVTFHSTMYPRRGNSCSYLIECHSHGRVVFGRVCVIFLMKISLKRYYWNTT